MTLLEEVGEAGGEKERNVEQQNLPVMVLNFSC
jgi:hypothetical protein